MQKLRGKLTYANVAATLALIVAVGGGSTAIAVSVNASKKTDVNKKGNIRAGRVTAKKLADANVTAAKLAGIDVVQANGTNGALATCPDGERLLGGGARMNTFPAGGGELTVSAPEGNGWHAAARGPADIDAFALCLKTTPSP